jgi:hypothetical protein
VVGDASGDAEDGTSAGIDVPEGSPGVAGVSAGAAGASTEALAGNDIGVPMLSSTTGMPAKGSFAADDAGVALVATCRCVSLTTGTRCATRLAVLAGAGARRAARAGCTRDGSGASRCTVGTRRSGSGALGSESVGSGTVRAGIAGARNAPTIGST